jgi:tight adherence protein C
MNWDVLVPLAAVFISVALAVGALASLGLARLAPARRRLDPSATSQGPSALQQLGTFVKRSKKPARQLSKSGGGESSRAARLQRRLEAAGRHEPDAASQHALTQLVSAALFGILPLAVLGSDGLLLAGIAAIVGYLIPDLLLARATRNYRRAIQNGLPDALDLIVVCVEAGSSLDQAILRTSEELEIALPALAQELRIVNGEIRAGKPRVEAFQGLAKRTEINEVRALVSMLMQTDRFGTSIAQALRTHAATSRIKRSQRAEERAAKVGVKLVFPLALCFVPALYVVALGPVVIRIVRTLF